MDRPDKFEVDFFLILYRKGQKRGQTSEKFVFLLLFFLILGKFKKYYIFSTGIDQEHFFSKAQMPLKNGKLLGAEFFP